MPSLHSQLKQLNAIVPESTRQEALRVRLINNIKFQQFNEAHGSAVRLTFFEFISFIFHPWRVARSFGAVVLGLTLIVGIGVGTTFGAGPGDPLYDFKIALERMPLAVLPQQEQIEKEVEWAQKRQSEMTIIIASNDSNAEKSKKIQTVAKHLSRNINEAEKGIEQLSKNNSAKISVAEAASSFKEGVRDIKKSLRQATLAVKDAHIDGGASAELNKVSTLVNAAEFYTLGVLIDSVEPKTAPQVGQVEPSSLGKVDGQEELPANGSKSADASPTVGKKLDNISKDSTLENSGQNGKEPKSASTEPQTPATQAPVAVESKNSSETVSADNKIIKDQIRKDLETAIKELEESISDVPVAQKQEPSGATSEQSSATATKNAAPDVVFNVEQIIDQEVKNRAEQARHSAIKELVNQARERIRRGAFKEAFEIIQKAQKKL